MKILFIPVTTDSFTRVNSDSNGNPRYVVHYTAIKRPASVDIFNAYQWAVNKAKDVLKGSRKFHNKQYGGGIVVSSYNLNDEVNAINLYNLEFVVNELLSQTANIVVSCERINKELYEVIVTDKLNALNDSNVRLFIHVESEDHDSEIKSQLTTKGLL